HRAIDHREPQTGAAFAFSGEEGFEAVLARLFVHAAAGVLYLEVDEAGIIGVAARAQRHRPALGHRVDGVENKIGERLAELAFNAFDGEWFGRELGAHLDHLAALLWHVAPARLRQ